MSVHFTLDELIFSQEAVRKNIDNTPSAEIKKNLEVLMNKLEEVRTLIGKPITVSSGYRCKELNTLIGGAANSAHIQGLAADINCSGMTPRDLALKIRDSHIEFDQLIYEGTWVHIGLSVKAFRKQVRTAVFNKGKPTVYTTGIN